MKRLLTAIVLSLIMAAGAYAGATPEYPGGEAALEKYLAGNMKYPQRVIDNGIEGKVTVAFTVKADGSIGNIKIVRMIDPDLEAEAVRLVKNMPAWTPADQNGNPVDAPVQIDINFSLPE